MGAFVVDDISTTRTAVDLNQTAVTTNAGHVVSMTSGRNFLHWATTHLLGISSMMREIENVSRDLERQLKSFDKGKDEFEKIRCIVDQSRQQFKSNIKAKKEYQEELRNATINLALEKDALRIMCNSKTKNKQDFEQVKYRITLYTNYVNHFKAKIKCIEDNWNGNIDALVADGNKLYNDKKELARQRANIVRDADRVKTLCSRTCVRRFLLGYRSAPLFSIPDIPEEIPGVVRKDICDALRARKPKLTLAPSKAIRSSVDAIRLSTARSEKVGSVRVRGAHSTMTMREMPVARPVMPPNPRTIMVPPADATANTSVLKHKDLAGNREAHLIRNQHDDEQMAELDDDNNTPALDLRKAAGLCVAFEKHQALTAHPIRDELVGKPGGVIQTNAIDPAGPPQVADDTHSAQPKDALVHVERRRAPRAKKEIVSKRIQNTNQKFLERKNPRTFSTQLYIPAESNMPTADEEIATA